MTIRVDYRCTQCGETREASVSSPPPGQGICPQCGGASRRRFSSFAVKGTPSRAEQVRAQRNVSVPGACSMHPEVASVWSARVRRDERALDSALRSQEKYMQRTGISPQDLASGGGHSHAHSKKIGGADALGKKDQINKMNGVVQ